MSAEWSLAKNRTDRHSLDQQILDAHARKDGLDLARLYVEAADKQQQVGKIDACCYFLTLAYVFALEAGSELAREINRRLVKHGREDPLPEE